MSPAPALSIVLTAAPGQLDPVTFHKRRLESSVLYHRRQHEAALTHQAAQLAAVWYLDAKYQPRYLDCEAR